MRNLVGVWSLWPRVEAKVHVSTPWTLRYWDFILIDSTLWLHDEITYSWGMMGWYFYWNNDWKSYIVAYMLNWCHDWEFLAIYFMFSNFGLLPVQLLCYQIFSKFILDLAWLKCMLCHMNKFFMLRTWEDDILPLGGNYIKTMWSL